MLRVVEIYPNRRELLAWFAPEESIKASVGDTWTDAAFPGLAIRVAELFVGYDRFLRAVD